MGVVVTCPQLPYHAFMGGQRETSFGDALAAALAAAGITQAELARRLPADAGLVSKWRRNHQTPRPDTIRKIEQILGQRLPPYAQTESDYELYVSAPITGLGSDAIGRHHAQVSRVVAATREHVEEVYWPGQSVLGTDDLVAPDLATERNLKVLAHCAGLLYVQMEEMAGPSSALIELGMAMGRRTRTTMILKRGIRLPFMLRDNFAMIAANLNSLPKARVYLVNDVDEATQLVARNGRELLGLN